MAGDEREKETTMHLPRLLRLLMAVALIASIAFVAGGATRSYAATGPIGTAAGFEDNDGNLTPAPSINFDWNSFAPLSWPRHGPVPKRQQDYERLDIPGVDRCPEIDH